jgi:hypothetical protein
MPPAGIESAIPANELPQNNAFDRAATGIGTSDPYAEPFKPQQCAYAIPKK